MLLLIRGSIIDNYWTALFWAVRNEFYLISYEILSSISERWHQAAIHSYAGSLNGYDSTEDDMLASSEQILGKWLLRISSGHQLPKSTPSFSFQEGRIANLHHLPPVHHYPSIKIHDHLQPMTHSNDRVVSELHSNDLLHYLLSFTVHAGADFIKEKDPPLILIVGLLGSR
ncbi:hypothetical protein PEBR_20337 [Penicillium brasilianum]|uniref:Uncharacterized protein n=1 Tax=Penicillium brasilianum TaxID=104259 RepID=A0A1S9RR81_PENBI|nr:hypothetical protein PEBR_20337 [Penicillium brasilianum]